MIYPGNISGIQFNDCEMLGLIFNGATLVLPFAETLACTRNKFETSSFIEFRNVDANDWNVDGFENRFIELVTQKWKFLDDFFLFNVAECNVKISVMELTDMNHKSYNPLDGKLLKKIILETYSVVYADEEEDNMHNPDWPKIHNEFNYKRIRKKDLDWMKIELGSCGSDQVYPVAFIPLNNKLVMQISFDIYRLENHTLQNPYSKNEIHKLNNDLFDEYIQSIDLRYTDETLASIRDSTD